MQSSANWLRRGLNVIALGTLAVTSQVSFAGQIGMETPSAQSPLTVAPQSMAPYWAKGGLRIQIATGQTLTKSLLKIAAGQLDSAIAPPLAYNAMKKGVGPYKAIAQKARKMAPNVRALFAIPGSHFLPIVWESSGITEFPQGAGKRVYIGPPAGAANRQIRTVLENGGLAQGQYDEIKSPWGAAAQGFQDGQYDIYVGAYSLGSQALSELSLSRSIRILSLPEDAHPPAGLGMATAIVPEGSFPGVKNKGDTHVWKTLMMMAVHKDMDDATAYKMTRIFMESRAEVAKGNAVLADLADISPFVGMNAKLHPGAVKYYREAGVSIPEHLLL